MIDYYEAGSQPITRLMVWQAYKKVRAGGTGTGVDAMSWDYLAKHAGAELYKLWNRLRSGSYFPMPVREVAIAKSDGGVRTLGIPTLLDRIAQEVVKHHLEKQLEPLFHNSSFGYRPGRSCHDAVAAAERNSFTHDFVIDLDIEGFFDNIDHELMLKALRHYCKDKWVLLYAERWLKAGVLAKGGSVLPAQAGTPQGGVISPLLANLFLHVAFDKWMEKEHAGKPFERYADDIVVHCKTEKQATYMLARISQRLNACKLTLHPVKTKIVNLRGQSEKKHPRSYDFLGFTIRPHYSCVKGMNLLLPATFISGKSKKRVHEKFRSMAIHKRRRPLEEVALMLRPVIRGIINYYHRFWDAHMYPVWYGLNQRLLKWVRWEKGLSKVAAVGWLRRQYAERPHLFAHWRFVHP
ncbi:MAG: group II intron reverse transcriptase/maturase [Chitinophagaceae bacterium]|nr:MAG: group II intron reverse transcriptase/maturase [Chitinophagaceae bacterium]